MRGQWQNEHRLHGMRDVTCDEDRLQVRCGHIPHMIAAFRHTAIGLWRWAGYSNTTVVDRRFAVQPVLALVLIGIVLEN